MPYNPGIQDRSGEILAGYLSQAAGTAADTIKREQDEAKLANGFRKIAPLLKDENGNPYITKEQADTMGGHELSAAFQAIGTKRTLDQMALQQQEMKRRAASETALGDFTEAYALGTAQQGPMPQGSTAFMNALAAHPRAAANPQFDNSVAAISRYAAPPTPALGVGQAIEVGGGLGHLVGTGSKGAHFVPAKEKFTPSEVPLGGGRTFVYTSPNSGQIFKGKEEGETVPDWVLSDDDKAFMAGLSKVDDSKEQERWLKHRIQIRRASGKESSLAEILMKNMGGTPGANTKSNKDPLGLRK